MLDPALPRKLHVLIAETRRCVPEFSVAARKLDAMDTLLQSDPAGVTALEQALANVALLTRAITGGDASAWDIGAIARLAEHQRCVSSLELPETR